MLLSALREGYGLGALRADALAGLTVAIVALPLSMALAIASGATPAQGLITAIVAGLFISALGGSRFQIGGPTGAFVVVVFGVIAHHGYDGLVLATLVAGGLLVAASLAGVGAWIKYVPDPVVTGFTSGIAVVIAASQIGDVLGLKVHAPADFAPKIAALWNARDTLSPYALALGLICIGVILAFRRWAPRWPAFLIVVAGASLTAALLHLPLDTIGSRFGGVPSSLPMPHVPSFSLEKLQAVLPSAFTIAFLGAIESLLSATVADGLTGTRHRPNAELMGQGIANAASALFGGLPATGAIARTATNIRAGARTPVAGMLHSVFLLAFMLLAAPLAAYAPLAALAAILLVVAWNMAETHRFVILLKGPAGDGVVLVATFVLTVFADLTLAIGVGVILSTLRFMHRMAEAVSIEQRGLEEEAAEALPDRAHLPPGVEVFRFAGPLFFGAASRLEDAFTNTGSKPKAIILRMGGVPFIDATAARLLAAFIRRRRAEGVMVVICGLQPRPAQALSRFGAVEGPFAAERADNFAAANDLILQHQAA
ncbi:MAG: SulP family inorganic anion transporter [Caulobacteraceae bacterium]